ncbi:hypothetical protein Agub_g9924, partial [Astrephomene gubernaculifera]
MPDDLDPPRRQKRHRACGKTQRSNPPHQLQAPHQPQPLTLPPPFFDSSLQILLTADPVDASSPSSIWRQLATATGLSLLQTKAYPPIPEPSHPLPEAAPEGCRRSLLRRGYARLPTSETIWGVPGAQAHARLCQRLASACTALRRLGWHLGWLLLYDEPWLLARMYGRFLERLSAGRLQLNPDFVFFHVEPGSRGWPPHRDRPSMPFLPSAGPGRLPAYITFWIALSAATPEQGCIYVLPADLDPLNDSSSLPPLPTATNHADDTAATFTVPAMDESNEESARRADAGHALSQKDRTTTSDEIDVAVQADLSVHDLQAVRAL